jgi:CubicO group peptidase (beta-lactamase class C family)
VAPTFAAARAVLQQAVVEHAFPAAVIEVGTATQPLWREAFGSLTYAADAPPTRDDTVFDLASLTKVLSTTPLVMVQAERGALGVDDRVADHIACWRGADREGVTIRDLLAHCGGLAAHLPFYREHQGRAQFEPAICGVPLEYRPRSKSIYSDLGFMLLGFILENGASLPERFAALLTQMGGIQDLQFHPPERWRPRIAPTEFDPWRGRLLIGEVDDENTAALGGAAGQAGLFGTAPAVGECARHLLQVLDGRKTF